MFGADSLSAFCNPPLLPRASIFEPESGLSVAAGGCCPSSEGVSGRFRSDGIARLGSPGASCAKRDTSRGLLSSSSCASVGRWEKKPRMALRTWLCLAEFSSVEVSVRGGFESPFFPSVFRRASSVFWRVLTKGSGNAISHDISDLAINSGVYGRSGRRRCFALSMVYNPNASVSSLCASRYIICPTSGCPTGFAQWLVNATPETLSQ